MKDGTTMNESARLEYDEEGRGGRSDSLHESFGRSSQKSRGSWAKNGRRGGRISAVTPCEQAGLGCKRIKPYRFRPMSAFTLVADLRSKLLNFIEYFNRVFAKPFQWTYTGRSLRAKPAA